MKPRNFFILSSALLATAVLGAATRAGEPRRADERAAAKYVVQHESNVKVPMRDGVHLATDLYLPEQEGRQPQPKVPAVLLRTPYGKGGFAAQARLFAGNGYLVAIQDCRGRFHSEGEFFPFRDDPQDGHDTIVWLTRHPRSNGQVGMYGCSYMAWVQFQAATQNPPGLATMVPWEGPTNAYHYSLRTGGALNGSTGGSSRMRRSIWASPSRCSSWAGATAGRPPTGVSIMAANGTAAMPGRPRKLETPSSISTRIAR